MTGLECGHKFCAKCWADYLTAKIIDEGMGQTISCAAFGCDILVDDTTVMSVVGAYPETFIPFVHHCHVSCCFVVAYPETVVPFVHHCHVSCWCRP